MKRNDGETKTLIHDMEYEDMVGWDQEVYAGTKIPRILVPVSAISFYCVMIPRSVWNLVGGLDPELEYRHNDQDFCLRAHQIGVPTLIDFAAFAFHFGTKTLNHLVGEDVKTNATAYFMQKWRQKA
jgi:GT2 family glycosyltransferase